MYIKMPPITKKKIEENKLKQYKTQKRNDEHYLNQNKKKKTKIG